MTEEGPWAHGMRMAQMAMAFARVNRISLHVDGERPESDTDHTVMVQLVAPALAEWEPVDLDVVKVIALATVHDLPEVYANDTPTLRPLSPAERGAKRARETLAVRRLQTELPQALRTLLTEYEAQATLEARFVRLVDKVVPKYTHVMNRGATARAQGMSLAELRDAHNRQLAELREAYPEFEVTLAVLGHAMVEVEAVFVLEEG